MEDIFDGEEMDEESQLALPHVMKAFHSRRGSQEENEFNKWVNAAKGEGEGQDILMDTGVEEPECSHCGDKGCPACDSISYEDDKECQSCGRNHIKKKDYTKKP